MCEYLITNLNADSSEACGGEDNKAFIFGKAEHNGPYKKLERSGGLSAYAYSRLTS
ncbi:MAG TPA: hypothetical protein PKG60_00840 [Spirochaetota bacterium]|nr:hypothetical protein [Spirochaetota bacterium]